MMYQPVPLVRYFSLVPKSKDDSDESELHSLWGTQKHTEWQSLEEEYRCVILAEAGAGKTFEMESRAKHIQQSGRAAFFIRIEDIEDGFENAFEVGCAESFENWLESHEKAWFFLDSVDEARLENPRAFEKAIRRFSLKIKSAQQRAHIYVSSRPYAWRARTDRELLEQYLPFEKLLANTTVTEESNSNEIDNNQVVEVSGALQVFILEPLDECGIRIFAEHRETPQVETLIIELHRANLTTMAARPFDLESILAKWKTEQKLDGRLELLQHNIELRLSEIDPSRSQRQPLNRENALSGVRLLAAAVIMTGEPGIRIPDATNPDEGIDAELVLGDWNPPEVRALLERGIFNDVIYGMVRFRHREVRELLAAEWFSRQLNDGHSRRAIESLFIREQYGQLVITPRLRPILPWLILFDNELRQKVLKISPEIVFEGGDAARLPLTERKMTLTDVVNRIAEGKDDHSARDNNAIARIAQPDLMNDTLNLIGKYRNNDDAIFFLGRLVWQGCMTECVPVLSGIAIDSGRGIYARIAATRAVMTCGKKTQINHLLNELIRLPDIIPRKLLAEVLGNASPDTTSANFLLASLEKVEDYKQYETSGLKQALHVFIDRFPNDAAALKPLKKIIIGLNGFLERKPYIERGECHVSKEFVWLLGAATHAVERLVSMRSEAALSLDALAIMLKVPAVRFWRSEDFDEYKNILHEIVPAWKELNDALFWKSIDEARGRIETKESERLIDDYSVQWLGHFWKFGLDRFDDVLSFITMHDFLDDKLVAVSLAFRLYNLADKPEGLLHKLKCVTEDRAEVKEYLDTFLNPQRSQKTIEREEQEAQRREEREKEKEDRNRNRIAWINRLRATPDVIRNPLGLKTGDFSNDQYWLLCEIEGNGDRSDGSNWKRLIPEFGEDVARAYRDAAISHWRKYVPSIRSEGSDTTTVSYQLLFAIAGLEIEASENDAFPACLTEAEVRHVLRYAIWELNGLPKWLEQLHHAFPELVLEAILTELNWELTHTAVDESMHYILYKLATYAPWMHPYLAPALIDWIEQNEIYNSDMLHYCICIVLNECVDSNVILKLVKFKVSQSSVKEQLATWYAVWVDLNAEEAIPAVDSWLSGLQPEEASKEAQLFITKLMGTRFSRNTAYGNGDSFSVKQLKALYILMHRYIRAEDDIERAGMGVYSPGLRDDAQDGRNALFNRLAAIPGKETYFALIELSGEHPVIESRAWMSKLAYKRAEEDADLEPWSAQQMREFARYQMSTPTTHRQLFDLTVNRLIDLKSWIEGGNDSPYRTWQRVEGETEMRNLVAGWLNHNSSGHYSCAQENELPNRQRPDIWTQNPLISSPVPIELKLLENWSGPELCERLRNQLAGDYLREETAGCGIMLLVWRGRSNQAHWQIEGQRVVLPCLIDALKSYWDSIAYNFSGVSAIEVILIDLTVRDIKLEG